MANASPGGPSNCTALNIAFPHDQGEKGVIGYAIAHLMRALSHVRPPKPSVCLPSIPTVPSEDRGNPGRRGRLSALAAQGNHLAVAADDAIIFEVMDISVQGIRIEIQS